ncbi:hypothetical protein KEM60_02069 [Austwickia sp. TVS 96-490-7B]|uniref:hypothetical protein n=1 Tax=Austwickia sp. TVS 96-490-7B TaxID=2830843 RepID=UPI001C57AF03|nr:hypothetical protein [Austwickia sp. TVS 96-490-7B]MBW3085858.1 hypothetical protein [Austwickia sp. TVS 96-490-7B]
MTAPRPALPRSALAALHRSMDTDNPDVQKLLASIPLYAAAAASLLVAAARANVGADRVPWVVLAPVVILTVGSIQLALVVWRQQPLPSPPEWSALWWWLSYGCLGLSVALALSLVSWVGWIYLAGLLLSAGIWAVFRDLGLPGWRGLIRYRR